MILILNHLYLGDLILILKLSTYDDFAHLWLKLDIYIYICIYIYVYIYIYICDASCMQQNEQLIIYLILNIIAHFSSYR